MTSAKQNPYQNMSRLQLEKKSESAASEPQMKNLESKIEEMKKIVLDKDKMVQVKDREIGVIKEELEQNTAQISEQENVISSLQHLQPKLESALRKIKGLEARLKARSDMLAVKEETIRTLTDQVKGLERVLNIKEGNETSIPWEWEIERKSIRIIKRSSSGINHELWEGIWNNATPVAIKMHKPAISREEILQETLILTRLQHEKIIQLYAVISREDPIYIITELMKCSLLEYLRGDGRSLNVPQRIVISAQIAAGMAYLEEKRIIHRDLAARNVQGRDGDVWKIANFDYVRKLTDDIYQAPSDENNIMIKWTAPEGVKHHRFSTQSDVWSFGILLHEIISYGRFPYPMMTNAQVSEALSQGYRMPRHPNCPDKLYSIMMSCWKWEPEERPTFQSLEWSLDDFYVTDSKGYHVVP